MNSIDDLNYKIRNSTDEDVQNFSSLELAIYLGEPDRAEELPEEEQVVFWQCMFQRERDVSETYEEIIDILKECISDFFNRTDIIFASDSVLMQKMLEFMATCKDIKKEDAYASILASGIALAAETLRVQYKKAQDEYQLAVEFLCDALDEVQTYEEDLQNEY